MMNGFFLNVIIITLIFNVVDYDIDFEPKQLFREIEKISGCNNPADSEIIMNSALNTSAGRYYKYSNASPVKYSYIGRVFTCRAEGCSVSDESKMIERAEFFDYFILFDSDVRVLSVVVFNYEATHGQQITVRSWLKQFVGYNANNELIVGKNIDAVSGATISVHGITNDITDRTESLMKHIRQY